MSRLAHKVPAAKQCERNITDGCSVKAPRKAELFDEESELFECEACGHTWDVEVARIDFNRFAEMVSVDDETGEPLQQAPIHRRWAELCEQHDRLLIWSHVNSGKTTQISILRTVWELGRDPTLRFVILSNVSSIATKIVKAIASYIENNEAVHEIFPDLKPDPKGTWTGTELTVVRDIYRKSQAKDPSVRAVGLHGALTSGRVDRLIIDDILDPESTDTEAARRKVESWYKAVAVGRLSRRAKILAIGTAYHPKDLLHVLAKQKNWRWFRFPVIDSGGAMSWPDAWPADRIDRAREEMGPAEFARQMLCKARDDGEARFKQEWIDAALLKGEGLSLVNTLDQAFPEGLPEGWAVFTGVDLGVKKTKRADETVFFTFVEDPKGNRRVLSIDAGKFTGPEIVEKIVDCHKRLGGIIAVESVAAQDFILQFARDISNVPVVPHLTTRAKRDPLLGVEGLAVELANGKWIIPCSAKKAAPQVEAWITEMLFYSPHAHTGDRLMAVYFAREIARKLLGNRTLPGVQVRVLGEDRSSAPGADGRSALSRIFDTDTPEEVSEYPEPDEYPIYEETVTAENLN